MDVVRFGFLFLILNKMISMLSYCSLRERALRVVIMWPRVANPALLIDLLKALKFELQRTQNHVFFRVVVKRQALYYMLEDKVCLASIITSFFVLTLKPMSTLRQKDACLDSICHKNTFFGPNAIIW